MAFGWSAEIAALLADGNSACAAGDASQDFGAAASLLDEFDKPGTELPHGFDQEAEDPRFCSAATRR